MYTWLVLQLWGRSGPTGTHGNVVGRDFAVVQSTYKLVYQPSDTDVRPQASYLEYWYCVLLGLVFTIWVLCITEIKDLRVFTVIRDRAEQFGYFRHHRRVFQLECW